MPRLISKFSIDVDVPQWDHCNEQKSKDSNDDGFCNFMVGIKDERYCKLFKYGLYSYNGWVKKCDKCLKESEVTKK